MQVRPFDWTAMTQLEIQGLLERTFRYWREQREQRETEALARMAAPEMITLEDILHPLTRGGS
jgi:hypothetical protein